MALQERFRALRVFALGIPAEKLDMRRSLLTNGCGCVLAHEKFIGVGAKLFMALSTRDGRWLFDDIDSDDNEASTYPTPTGQPAKDEFLRRLSVLEEKYCP